VACGTPNLGHGANDVSTPPSLRVFVSWIPCTVRPAWNKSEIKMERIIIWYVFNSYYRSKNKL